MINVGEKGDFWIFFGSLDISVVYGEYLWRIGSLENFYNPVIVFRLKY